MGIQAVLIYVIRCLEPKFHWDGMKNELSTYEYLKMGKIQFRASQCKKKQAILRKFTNF